MWNAFINEEEENERRVKRVTIRDVAREAGVSITTVSHALSGGGSVKQETRERIRALAKSMNYMPDWSGQNLKSTQTGVIGLYIPYIRGFYGLLADSMYVKCQEEGYELDVVIAEKGETILRNLLSHRVDGAIILNHGFSARNAEIVRNAEIPAVFLDRELVGPLVSNIRFDSYQTGRMAAEYLYELGHRRILLVEGSDTYDGNERRRGFLDYLEEKGILQGEDYQIPGGFDREIAHRSVERFLTKRLPMPTAVFAANDDSAIGCMIALMEAGYEVPDDVSIIGCDNIELSQWYVPPLTTIDTGVADMGRKAIEEVAALIREEHSGSTMTTEGRLVERASCVRLASGR